MISTTSYKFRIYPNQKQKDQFFQDFGSAKFAWNFLRHEIEDQFNQTAKFDESGKYIQKSAKSLSYNELSKKLTQLRSDVDFMRSGMRTAQQQKLKDLTQAYSNFFSNPKHFKKPRYKDKYCDKSVRYQDCKYPVRENSIFVAGMGWISCVNSYYKANNKKQLKNPDLPDLVIKPKMITVSQGKTGRFWATCSIEQDITLLEITDNAIGLDLGINTFVYTSDGEEINYNKKKLARLRKYSRRYQRWADKCKKESNRNKRNRELQNKTNQKIKNIVGDLQHKTTTEIIKNNQIIVIEDLNIVGMLKNPNLAKSIKEQNWGSFIEKLKYKTTRYGRTLVRVPRFFPSSKLCSCCGHKMEKMPLSIRNWTCPVCKSEHNRDHNAAINIRDCGLNQLIPGGAGEFTDVDIEQNWDIARSDLDISAMDESSTYILVDHRLARRQPISIAL